MTATCPIFVLGGSPPCMVDLIELKTCRFEAFLAGSGHRRLALARDRQSAPIWGAAEPRTVSTRSYALVSLPRRI